MSPCTEKRLGYVIFDDEPVLTDAQWFIGCLRAFSWRYQRNGVKADAGCV